MNDTEISGIIPLLIPLVLVQLALMGIALFDLVKRKQVKGGNKFVWGAVIVLFQYIGPILYLVIGREED